MLKKYSVNKINRISRNREVWCWGSGFQYGRMIKTHSNEVFVTQIKGIIDSNKKIQGSIREIGDRRVSIFSPEEILNNSEKKYLLIISCDAYMEIYKDASKLFKEIDIVYTVYPKVYYQISNFFRGFFCKLPLKRQLLFYVGSNESQPQDNSDEIVRFLQREYKGKPYSLVYLTDYPCKVPNGVKQISVSDVRNKSSVLKVMKYYYYYARSMYLFFESGPTGKLRNNQKTCYLNHGTIPLKYVKDALKQPQSLNYAVCPGPGCTKFYEEQYSIDKEKLLYMMPPRVKNIFEDASHKVDALFGLEGEQMILWLPTFRKLERGDKSERRDSKVDSPLFTLVHSEDIKYVNECLLHNFQKLVIKCHPREKDDLVTDIELSNIIITTDEQLNENGLKTHNLMNRANALISDYSGVTFEYMFLDRPIGYYIPDFEDYVRGFSVDNPLDYMPGIKMNSVMDLMEFLIKVKEGCDDYFDERNNLRKNLFAEIDPCKGAETLVDFLDAEANRKRKY